MIVVRMCKDNRRRANRAKTRCSQSVPQSIMIRELPCSISSAL
jgi:hypothetical protein